MGFMRSKTESYEQLGVRMQDKEMYVKVYDSVEKKVFEGKIYDWQLDALLKLDYIMIDSKREYKIDKIFFDLCPQIIECNLIYIFVKSID